MQNSIIVFRHGSVCSDENIFLGWLNPPLNADGLRQAETLSEKLKDERIDFGFCSDQFRSKQVLHKVLLNHSRAQVIIDHRLRERDYGSFSGHNKETFSKRWPGKYDEIKKGYYTLIPKGESIHQVSQRVFPFMNDLLRFVQANHCNVAISAHNNSMRLIEEYLGGLSVKDTMKLINKPSEYKKFLVSFE